MRTAELVTDDRATDAGISDGETIFNGLLLAVIGHRRLLVLIGDAPAARVGLLARLARHVETEGCMVMTVAAGTGVTVEDLVEVAGAGMLGQEGTPPGFDRLVELLEERLDQCGTGILMVEEADKLAPDTLRDLVELSGSITPSGHFLQILLSGGPELRRRLDQAGLMPTIDTVGTLYTLDGAAGPEPGALRVRTSAPRAGIDTRAAVRRRGGGVARTVTSAALILALVAGGWWVYDRGWIDADRIAALVDGADGPIEPAGPDALTLRPEQRAASAPETRSPAPQDFADREPVGDGTEPGFTREDVEQFADLAGRVLREDPRLGGADSGGLDSGRLDRDGGMAAPSGTGTATDSPGPDVRDDPAAPTGALAGADPVPSPAEEPPAAESEPLSADELAAMDAAPEPGSLAEASAGDGSTDQDMGTDPDGRTAEDVADQDDVAIAAPFAAGPAPTQPSPAQSSPAQQARLDALIDRAEAQIADRKLTTPRNDAAFYTMQEIRAIDPDHPVLDDMRRRILDTYQRWADTAEQRRDWRTASVYYQRALRVAPANARITARLDRVEDIRAGRPARSPAATGREAPPEPQLRP